MHRTTPSTTQAARTPSPAQAGEGLALLAWLSLAFALALALALPTPAKADGLDPSAFAGSFDDVRRGIEQAAVSGDPHAADVLTALQQGRLFVRPDRGLAIKTDAGTIDPLAGTPVEAAGLKPVRINNAIRRALDSALGSLDLFLPDPGRRRSAADAVFKAHDPASLPGLDRALGTEKDPGVKAAMEQARAAIIVNTDIPESERLAAVHTLGARGDADARALLSSLQSPSPAVAKAAAAAVASIDRMQTVWTVLQGAFYGLSLGSVLLLAAAGLAITFGVMGVINMAHGEMMMLGAYTTYAVQQAILSAAPNLFGASLLFAVPAAFIVSGAVGVALERLLIRHLYGRPLDTLLATWGVSLALQQAVRSIFGASNRDVGTPLWMSGADRFGGVTITYNRLTIIVFAVAVLVALIAVLRFTPMGLRMRAVTQNRRMAAAMGIRTPWIDALTFGLGSGFAGMAGVAISQIDNVSPNLGQGYIIDSFMVVVFGGVGNLWGTALAAMVLGAVNKFLEPLAGAVLGKIVVLVLLIVFIQRKPRGLFPLKGRAVEA